jgi:hypothetical protein
MTDIVKGMGGEFARVLFSSKYFATDAERHEAAMRAALLFLADNVSGEMVHAYVFAPAIGGRNVDENVRKSISAAIRAAAGGGE